MKKAGKKFKLRVDLLEYVTPEDLIAEAGANVSRFKPEPLLARTGKGYLRPATPQEREAEIRRSDEFIRRLEARRAAAKRARRKKNA
jgi:hypothetical protein